METFTLVFFLSMAAVDEQSGQAWLDEGSGLTLSECAKLAVKVLARESLYDDAPGFICTPDGDVRAARRRAAR